MALATLSDLLTEDSSDTRLLCRDGLATINVAQLRRDVQNAASALPAARPVAVHCKSAYRFLVAILAVWARQSTVILPPNAQPDMLADLSSSFEVLLCDTDLHFNGPTSRLDRNATASTGAEIALPKAETCAITFYTSGSTDRPKAITKSLAMLQDEAQALEQIWGRDIDDCEIQGLVSHQHIYGMLFRVIWPTMAGRPFQARMLDYWEEVATAQIPAPVLVASPAHLTRIPAHIELQPRLVFSSGGPLPRKAALNAGAIFGCAPVEVYGSTETGGIAYRSQAGENDSPWRPLPGVAVSRGENDRLAIISRHMGNSAPYLTDDQVLFTRPDRFILTGRVGRVVKVEGKRVSLSQVEHALKQSPTITDAAALLAGDGKNELVALVVLNHDGKSELEKIGAFRMGRKLRQELSQSQESAALPKRWRFVDVIPMNAQGKRPLQEMRALFDNRSGDGAGEGH